MKLTTLHYDPSLIPENQQFAKLIPPSGVVDHAEIKTAIERYEEAREANREARQTHVDLVQGLPAAEKDDQIALADAREKGKADPGDKHAARHKKEIDEARRDEGARQIALERAIAGVTKAFDEHGDEFEASLRDADEKLYEAMTELLAGWLRFWNERQQVQANLDIGKGFTRPVGTFLSSITGPGGVMPVADAVEKLAALGAPATPKAAQVVEHRLNPGQTEWPKETEDRRHPGQTERAVDPEAERKLQERSRAEQDAAVIASKASHAERQARAEAKLAEREAQREAEREAVGF